MVAQRSAAQPACRPQIRKGGKSLATRLDCPQGSGLPFPAARLVPEGRAAHRAVQRSSAQWNSGQAQPECRHPRTGHRKAKSRPLRLPHPRRPHQYRLSPCHPRPPRIPRRQHRHRLPRSRIPGVVRERSYPRGTWLHSRTRVRNIGADSGRLKWRDSHRRLGN